MSTGFLADQGKPHGHASADLLTGFVPFPEDRAQAYREAGYWTGRPLNSILTDAAARWPDRTAIVDSADREASSNQFFARSWRCSTASSYFGS